MNKIQALLKTRITKKDLLAQRPESAQSSSWSRDRLELFDRGVDDLTFIKTLMFGLLKLLDFLLSLFQLLFQCLTASFLLFFLVCFRSGKLFIIGLCFFFGPTNTTSVVL